MKRIAIIISVLFLLIIGFLGSMYVVRKSDIKNQYVGSSSTRILSIAIDDLLLDNVTSILPWNSNQKENGQGKDLFKNIIFNAGIYIPARIYLFDTTPHMRQLYGILALKNYDDCFSFFANEFPDGIDLIDKEKGIVSVTINNHIKVLFNRSHFIYEIAVENKTNFSDLQAILEQPTSWTKIDSISGFEGVISQKHISYIQKDGALQIQGMISKHHTQVDGKWTLSQSLSDTIRQRTMDTTKQVITFWNLLPLNEIPVLAEIMSKYTGVNLSQINSAYFDLQVKDEFAIHKDSSITYTYDDDFNPKEQIQVQEIQVPNITYSWSFNKLLAESLPDTLFYKFHKKQTSEFLINSTFESFPAQVTSQKTKHPLYFFIDFGKWPATWNLAITNRLKDKKVKVKLLTTLENPKNMHISGEITY